MRRGAWDKKSGATNEAERTKLAICTIPLTTSGLNPLYNISTSERCVMLTFAWLMSYQHTGTSDQTPNVTEVGKRPYVVAYLQVCGPIETLLHNRINISGRNRTSMSETKCICSTPADLARGLMLLHLFLLLGNVLSVLKMATPLETVKR
jgi:hypothetical protein